MCRNLYQTVPLYATLPCLKLQCGDLVECRQTDRGDYRDRRKNGAGFEPQPRVTFFRLLLLWT